MSQPVNVLLGNTLLAGFVVSRHRLLLLSVAWRVDRLQKAGEFAFDTETDGLDTLSANLICVDLSFAVT